MRLIFRISSLLLLLFYSISTVRSQQHDNIWLFGYAPNIPEEYFGGSMLDFSVEPPFVSYFEIPISFRATASVCDYNGQLIAYTNGCSILSRHHLLAENGDSINPGFIHDQFCQNAYPIPQGVIFVPVENVDQAYRLIHLWTESGIVEELKSTELRNTDTTAVITNKNINIDSRLFSWDLTTVRHANGRDWWVVLARQESNIYDKYISDLAGVHIIHSQEIGVAWTNRDWSGQVTYSPDGTKFVRVNPFNGLHIFDFDRCTGMLSNPKIIDFPNDTISSSGAAFSSDSRFLYVSATNRVYQFDMWATDVSASREVVAVYDGFLADHDLSTRFYQQMLAPNGKIYITAPNSVRYLHIIHDPKEKGVSCNLEQHGLAMPTLHAFSPPNFPHYRLGPVDGSPCDTLGLNNMPVAKFRYAVSSEDPLKVKFTDLSYYEPVTRDWHFGDGESNFGSDQWHTYDAPGIYEVCLTVSNAFSSDISCQWIEVSTTASHDIPKARKVLSLYPNPVDDFLYIASMRSDFRPVALTLYDLQGQVVFQTEIFETLAISLVGIQPGMYVCCIRDQDGDEICQKIVKM